MAALVSFVAAASVEVFDRYVVEAAAPLDRYDGRQLLDHLDFLWILLL